jgi:LysR family glycine cleavage system transcriptional activator
MKRLDDMISRAYQVPVRRLPPLQAVKVFEAAARHENFTLAAVELGMTQAAVSYQVRLLEERLGMPLFVRARRRVSLSEAGRRIAPAIGAAFDGIAEAFAAIVDEDEGVLTISTSQTFTSNWLAPRLGTFQIERPELAVRLQTSNMLVDFAREDVDVAIRFGDGLWPGLRRHFLFRLHSTPLCTPEFRDRHAIAAPPDLLRVPRLSPDDPWWREWLSASGVAYPDGIRQPGIRLDSQASEGVAVLAGHGVGMMTPLYWKSELASGRLVQLFDLVVPERIGLWLVYPEHKRNRAKIRAFRDWLLREIALEAASAPPFALIPPEAASGAA